MPWEVWLCCCHRCDLGKLSQCSCISRNQGWRHWCSRSLPSPLGFGGPSAADPAELLRGALALLEAVRACYRQGQLVPTAVGLGRLVPSRHCWALIALELIRVEELGHCVDLTSLQAVDFHEAGGSGFSETFQLEPNHLGTSQRVQEFF